MDGLRPEIVSCFLFLKFLPLETGIAWHLLVKISFILKSAVYQLASFNVSDTEDLTWRNKLFYVCAESFSAEQGITDTMAIKFDDYKFAGLPGFMANFTRGKCTMSFGYFSSFKI